MLENHEMADVVPGLSPKMFTISDAISIIVHAKFNNFHYTTKKNNGTKFMKNGNWFVSFVRGGFVSSLTCLINSRCPPKMKSDNCAFN